MHLTDYSAVAISISGGKDSQTILGVVADMAREQAYSGKLIAIHANTGGEWPQSLPHCQMLCKHYNIELVVATPFRALPEHIEARCRKLQAAGKKGGWPSSTCRYCTSDCKRNPIQKVLRGLYDSKAPGTILSITGERRQESSHRAKLAEIEPHKTLTAGNRKVTMWRPILDYTLDDVWSYIRETGLPRHIAYDKGNERLSCAMCVLATEADIRRGAAECPDMRDHFLRIERETGHTFKNGKSLAQILEGGKDAGNT